MPDRVDCLLAALLEEAGVGEASRYGIRGGKSPKQRVDLARERGELPRQQPAAA
ncbi:hypothetical protein [Streptomyces cyaneofuscatus]|uniref:hypothetical protein n=1 Tax=Streptomyces cyaneofuscatus TaxID=66883 RepID=UPI0036D97259